MKPEDFQKQFAELMRQHMPNFGNPAGFQAHSDPPEETQKEEEKESFSFDYRPRDVKAYLDRYVIQQEEAKKVLSVALCDHYHHVRLAREGKSLPNYAKQNILLLGPTGVGKTYLIRSVAELIGVPFVKGDATKFSETGYVGGDVEDLVRELYRRSDGDVQKAQFGIIYIDEIDKIAQSDQSSGRDISGLGVQTNLLKLMEETDVSARSQQDIAGQIQAMMDFQNRRKTESHINTKHILFIVSGAFEGLERIIKKRLNESEIGFAAAPPSQEPSKVTNYLERMETRDLLDYGFEPEFAGRLPVRVVCQPLAEDDLYVILKSSEGSIIRQYEADFAAYGIEIFFAEEALRRIASLAAAEKTGARGLMTICERVFRNYKFELPGSSVQSFEVTRDVIDAPEIHLKQILRQQDNPEIRAAKSGIDEFTRKFEASHGLILRFTEDGMRKLLAVAAEEKNSPREICRTRFKDFQFGLKLIAQNTGQSRFDLDAAAVKNPEKVLSDWVVASYRNSQKKAVSSKEGGAAEKTSSNSGQGGK